MAEKVKAQEEYIGSLEAANAVQTGGMFEHMSTLKTSQASAASYTLTQDRNESLEL